MELRVLKYFLVAAGEENITRAAKLLHITQPTLSRQLMQMEEELGVTLLRRSRHSITLTEEGMLLRRRAQEIVDLAEKTEREISRQDENLPGEISIGCGETRSMHFIADAAASFRERYPLIQFDIYSATADEIKERMERGLLDLGLLMEPADISRYKFIRMPVSEQWGVLVRKDSAFAGKSCVHPEDLRGTPLIMARRKTVKNELINWFGDAFSTMETAAAYNLITNAVAMVESGVGAAICCDLGHRYSGLTFIPLEPKLEAGSVLVWKRHQELPWATLRFIDHVKEQIQMQSR